jgi:hypothetical protein
MHSGEEASDAPEHDEFVAGDFARACQRDRLITEMVCANTKEIVRRKKLELALLSSR